MKMTDRATLREIIKTHVALMSREFTLDWDDADQVWHGRVGVLTNSFDEDLLDRLRSLYGSDWPRLYYNEIISVYFKEWLAETDEGAGR